MLPKYHAFFSLIASLILYLFGMPIKFVLFFFLSAIIIDIDHYFLYILRKKKVSLIGAYNYNKYDLVNEMKRQKQKYVLVIFHTIEFFILIFILSFFFNILWPVFFGFIFHESIDLVYESRLKDKKYKRAFSLIYYVWKNKTRTKNLTK